MICQKTVYANEAVTTSDGQYHKLCFRCEEPGCGLALNLKTFNAVGNKIWCGKHTPRDKPTSTTVEGRMDLTNAKVAHGLKDQTVNPQVANVEHKNLQVLDMHHSNAINAHNLKDQTINPQVRAGHEKNAQVLDMHHANATKSPRAAPLNHQIYNVEHTNSQVLDVSQQNAMNAPKAFNTVNEQIKSGNEKNAQVLDISHSNALNAPKVFNPVNEQIRGESTADN
jgi:hypothetical protein